MCAVCVHIKGVLPAFHQISKEFHETDQDNVATEDVHKGKAHELLRLFSWVHRVLCNVLTL